MAEFLNCKGLERIIETGKLGPYRDRQLPHIAYLPFTRISGTVWQICNGFLVIHRYFWNVLRAISIPKHAMLSIRETT